MSRDLSLSEIFQLGYYWETKILLTGVKFELFTMLDGKELGAGEMAHRLHADAERLELLMNALVAMRVLIKQADRFANTPVAQTYLVKTAAQYVGHLLVLQDAEWDNWGRLEETIRTGQSPVARHLFETNPGLGVNVLSVLDRIGQHSGPELARRLKLEGLSTLLDLGGGAATNAIACCQAYPALKATVFDLPDTLKMAEKRVKEAGLESRIELKAGNFNRDGWGGPYDAILMSDILHYQGLEANTHLVKQAFLHLRSDGRLIIKDRFLDELGTSPAWATAFAVHILVNTEQGRCFKVSEAIDWMTKAGFQSVSELERTAVVQGFKS